MAYARDLIVLDVDGVLVPVIGVDPAHVVMEREHRNALIGHCRRRTDALCILTGRSRLSEVDRIAGLNDHPLLARIPVMTAHGYQLHVDGEAHEARLPEDVARAMQAARALGHRIIKAVDDGGIPREVAVTVQHDRLNVNVSQVGRRTRPAVVETLRSMMLATPGREPLEVRVDPDGTFVELHGGDGKGRNLVQWLRDDRLPRFDRHLVIVADNLQPGGSDRGLAESAVAALGRRVRLWQSLDGVDKRPLADTDPLRPHLDLVLDGPEDVARELARKAG